MRGDYLSICALAHMAQRAISAQAQRSSVSGRERWMGFERIDDGSVVGDRRCLDVANLEPLCCGDSARARMGLMVIAMLRAPPHRLQWRAGVILF